MPLSGATSTRQRVRISASNSSSVGLPAQVDDVGCSNGGVGGVAEQHPAHAARRRKAREQFAPRRVRPILDVAVVLRGFRIHVGADDRSTPHPAGEASARARPSAGSSAGGAGRPCAGRRASAWDPDRRTPLARRRKRDAERRGVARRIERRVAREAVDERTHRRRRAPTMSARSGARDDDDAAAGRRARMRANSGTRPSAMSPRPRFQPNTKSRWPARAARAARGRTACRAARSATTRRRRLMLNSPRVRSLIAQCEAGTLALRGGDGAGTPCGCDAGRTDAEGRRRAGLPARVPPQAAVARGNECDGTTAEV